MKQKRRKNRLLNILINLVIPIIILTKYSTNNYLGPKLGLIVALIFPLIYGILEFRTERRVNLFSGLGVVSVILTGIIGLFEFPNALLALKEASIPLIVGLALIVSQRIGHPLLNELLKEALDFEKIFKVAEEKNKLKEIKEGLKISNYVLAAVFFASAVANYMLAKLLVTSVPGTADYNAELGALTGISFVVILVPFLIAFILIMSFLINHIKKKTSLKLEEIVI